MASKGKLSLKVKGGSFHSKELWIFTTYQEDSCPADGPMPEEGQLCLHVLPVSNLSFVESDQRLMLFLNGPERQ